jgi:hypothetical protein
MISFAIEYSPFHCIVRQCASEIYLLGCGAATRSTAMSVPRTLRFRYEPFFRALSHLAPPSHLPHRLPIRCWNPTGWSCAAFDVAFDDLPEACDGLRIAQLSDLHCSAITPPHVLRRAIEVCNEQRADVVVLTGDYISRRDSYSRFSGARSGARPVMDYAEAAVCEMRNLRAPEGVYAVPGNHDHTNGSFEAIELLLRQANITPLVNTSTRLRETLPLIALMTCALARSICPGFARCARRSGADYS